MANDSGRITRREFVKRAGVGAAALGAGLSGTAGAESVSGWIPDIVIHGTDDPARDIPAIQDAVNNPAVGRILLAGRFNFGTPDPARLPQSVFINRDMEIRGQRDPQGHITTVIYGGYRAFTVGYPSKTYASYDPTAEEVVVIQPQLSPSSFSIRDVRFEYPLYTAIWLAATKGETKIAGCEFINGVTLSWGGLPIARAAMIFSPNNSLLQPTLPGKIHGSISFSGNKISSPGAQGSYPYKASMYGRDWYGFSHCIFALSFSADLEVSDNEIKGFHGAGLALFMYQNKLNVSGNLMISADTCLFGQGIYVAGVPGPSASAAVMKNEIRMQNSIKAPYGGGVVDGIRLIGRYDNNLTVFGNSITLAGPYALPGNTNYSVLRGISVMNTANGAVFQANRIGGAGNYGIIVSGPSYDNVFAGNSLPELSAANASYLFGPQSHDNIVRGDAGTLVDQGMNNLVTGWVPMQGSGGLGEEVSESRPL